MSVIYFDCDVTEFEIDPNSENDENTFCLNEKCLVISLMNVGDDRLLMQTEIEKKDAIQLAKLILLKYEN